LFPEEGYYLLIKRATIGTEKEMGGGSKKSRK
jgi:hypothetical protein